VRDFFNVVCHNSDVWHTKGLPSELFVTVHMLITMLYITLYFIVFWIIPFSNNQIIKTPKEIVKEREAKRKKKEKKAKEEANKSGDSSAAKERSNSAQSSGEGNQIAIPKINDSTLSTISGAEKR